MTVTLRVSFAALLLVGCAVQVDAQVIQLPSQQIFHVSTTVSVPDSGRAYAGGVRRLREGRVSRGVPGLAQLPGVGRLFKNRGIGREASNAGMSVHAEVLDLEELERQQVGTPGDLVASSPSVHRKASYLSKHIARTEPQREASKPVGNPLPGVEEIRRRHELARRQQELEVQEHIIRGKAAEADGKLGVAKIYYGMAQRKSSGQMRQFIIAHLEKLKRQQQSPSLASGN